MNQIIVSSWNVRGLNDNDHQIAVREELKRIKSDLILLLETKVKRKNLSAVMTRVWPCAPYISNHDFNPSGRVVVAWNPQILDVEPVEMNDPYIHFNVHVGGMIVSEITAVYAHNDELMRKPLWLSLASLSSRVFNPWIVTGDFNAVWYSVEKLGKLPPTQTSMDEFNLALHDAKLFELQHKGAYFTWSNNQLGKDCINTRIDRVLCNELWMNKYKEAWAEVIPSIDSDHCVLCIHSAEEERVRSPFRFINAWVGLQGFKNAVNEAWATPVQGCPMRKLMHKLSLVKRSLIFWNKHKIGDLIDNAENKRRYATDILNLLAAKPDDVDLQALAKNAKSEAIKASAAEENIIRQKSRIQWLKLGDQNTKFFYTSLRIRRSRNKIKALTINGEHSTNTDAIKSHIVDTFEDLFNRPIGLAIWLDEWALPMLDRYQAANLCNEFNVKDVEDVVFSASIDKAPGPDGFGASFYQSMWTTVKEDVCKAVLNFFQTGKIHGDANKTFLALIPKGSEVRTVKDLRPISLCNFIFKIITKPMTNRLQLVMPSIIDPNQCAFVKGRSISDAILLANELVSDFNRKTGKPKMCLKADLSKAYDTVRWNYICIILKKMGFPARWIKWTYMCMSTATFQVLVNGEPSRVFGSTNGLRQGDPLAPYMFVIAMQGLTAMMNHAVQSGKLTPPCAGNVKASHLIFADDLLIFADAKRTDAEAIKEILSHFEMISGLALNPNKSQIFCNKEDARDVCDILGVQRANFPVRYLGLPLFAGRIKRSMCLPLLDKMKARLDLWKSRMLSMAGRLELVISTLAAYNIFWAAAIPIPVSVTDEADKICRDFLWGDCAERKKLHTVAWDIICKPKKEGGLGVRKAREWVEAGIATKLWNVVAKKDSLWVKWIHARYLLQQNVWSFIPDANCSWMWKTVVSHAVRLRHHVSYNLGNGEKFRFWLDPWFDNKLLTDIVDDRMVLYVGKELNCTVAAVFEGEKFNMKTRLTAPLHDLLKEITLTDQPDHISLGGNDNPKLKNLWNATRDGAPKVPWYGWVWLGKLPPRWNLHAWKCALGKIPTLAYLRTRGFSLANRCCLCEEDEESLNHIAFECSFTKKIWTHIQKDLPWASLYKDWNSIFKSTSRKHNILVKSLYYHIWIHRNNVIFSGVMRDHHKVYYTVMQDYLAVAGL